MIFVVHACQYRSNIIVADEPGAFIGKIISSNPARDYLGYVNQEESDKKVIRDVFKKGDSAFLSG